MPYANSPNKAAVRRDFDQPILGRWISSVANPLTYFGLTGPEIIDFIESGSFLGEFRTSVESVGRSAQDRRIAEEIIGRLQSNVLVYGMSQGFQLLRGDIEDVIIRGTDIVGTPPQLNDGLSADLMHFGYDFINLDFDGGLGYRDGSGRAKRIDALKKLFERQEGRDFLLFLTINARHTLGTAPNQYIDGLKGRLQDDRLSTMLDWHLAGAQVSMLKVVVPSLIHSAAELRGFKVYSYPPVTYVGHERARMLHFAFELRHQPGDLRSFSQQTDRDLIELPLLTCKDESMCRGTQCPGFDTERLGPSLDFLSNEISGPLILSIDESIFCNPRN